MRNVDFDDISEDIGPLGRYQIWTIILIGVAQFPVGYNNMANVFIAGLPTYTCHVPADINGTEDSQGYPLNESLFTSPAMTATERTVNEAACDVRYGDVIEPCTRFNYDTDVYKSTIATQWDLVCGEEWKLAVTQSVYMSGVLVGSIIFGNLSDVIGRKVTAYLSLVLIIVTSCAAAFMPYYWLFTGMRFLVGAASIGSFTTGFVHTMEVLGRGKRLTIGIMYQGWFAAGYILLAIAAYFIRDYRYLQLSVGLFSIIYLPNWCLLGESPRWLLAEGRYDEGVREVKRAARMNKRHLPDSLLNTESTSFTERDSKDGDIKRQKHTVFVLLKTPNMRRKTLNTWFQWLVISMIYYGLSLGVGELAGGPYFNLILSGLMEFPGYIIAVLVLDRVGRRLPLSGFNLIGGISCIAMACIPGRYGAIVTAFSMCGKLAISASFAVIYVYCAELFPTVVRTIGVGSGTMCAMIGSLMSPFIALLSKYWKPLPYLVFGAFSLTAGLIALLLPETLNQPLPESIEDGELFGTLAQRRVSKIRYTAGKMSHTESLNLRKNST